MIGLFVYLTAVAIWPVVCQEYHIRGDVLNRAIENTDRLPPVHQRFSSPTSNGTFTLTDTMVESGKESVEGCALIAEVPSYKDYIISDCKNGKQLRFEHLAETIKSKKIMLTAVQEGYNLVDAAPLMTDISTKHAAVSIWFQPADGKAKVGVHLFHDSNTGNSTWFDVNLVDSASEKFKNPRISAFCVDGFNCKALIYDFNGTSKCTVKVYEIGTSDTPTIKHLADTDVSKDFSSNTIYNGLIVQSGLTNTIVFMVDQGVFTTHYNLTSDGSLVKVGNPSSTKEVTRSNMRIFLTYLRSKIHLISVTSPEKHPTKVLTFLRFTSHQYYIQAFEMPVCMKLSVDRYISKLQFKGIQGAATYTSSNGQPLGHALFYRDPITGDKIWGICIESSSAVSTYFNTERSELAVVDTSSTTYYSINNPRYRLDTSSLSEGEYKFDYEMRDTSGATPFTHKYHKSIKVFTDPFNMPPRTSPLFREAWASSETAELFSSRGASSFELSKNELLCNGCDVSIQGDHTESYSTKTMKVEYSMALGTKMTASLARTSLLKRDFVAVSDNKKTEIWRCVQEREEAKTCYIHYQPTYQSEDIIETVPGFEGSYIVSTRNYWMELVKVSLGQSFSYQLRLHDLVKKSQLGHYTLNSLPTSSFWRTSGDEGQLLLLTSDSEVILKKITLVQGQITAKDVKVYSDQPKLCIKSIAASQHIISDFWVHSECDSSSAFIQKFNIEESEAYPVQNTYQKVKGAQGVLSLCNIHNFMLYMPASRTDIKALSVTGDLLDYNFPKEAKAVTLEACVPEAGIQVIIREKGGKNYLIAIGYATNDNEEAAERYVTSIELTQVANAEEYTLSATFDRRDMSVHVLLTKKAGLKDQKLTAYKIATDDGEVVIRAAAGQTIGNMQLVLSSHFSTQPRAIDIKYRKIDPKSTPEIISFKVLPTNKAGIFNLDEYAKIEGNYFGVEVSGDQAGSIEIKDRVRSNSTTLRNSINLDGIVVAAGNFMATAKPGNKMVLHKDPLKAEGSQVTLDDLPSVDEAVMVKDAETGHVLLVARMETIEGNKIILYWLEANQMLPTVSLNLKKHQWSSKHHLIRLNLFATKALEGSAKHYVVTTVSESRRAAFLYFLIFEKDFSSLMRSSMLPLQHRSIFEDLYLNADRKWIYVKQRGSSFMTLNINSVTGESITAVNVRVHRAIENAVVIAVYCLRSGPAFCMYETHARYVLVEHDSIKKIYPKIPGYETAAWLTSGEYIGILLKSTWQKDGPANYKVAIYRHNFNGLYASYDIGAIDDVVLGENLMNTFALVESGAGVVLVTSHRLRKRQKLLQQDPVSPSFPLIADKIEVNIKADNLSGESLKFLFKAGDPSDQPVTRGVFVDKHSQNHSENQDSGRSSAFMWIVILIVVVLAAAGVAVYFLCLKKEKPASHRMSVMPGQKLLSDEDLDDDRL